MISYEIIIVRHWVHVSIAIDSALIPFQRMERRNDGQSVWILDY